MGGHNGLELEVKINILVPSHFHVTCIQSSVMYTKIRSATTPPPLYSMAVDLLSKVICVVFLFILVG